MSSEKSKYHFPPLRLSKVRQHFPRPRVADVPQAVAAELAPLRDLVPTGARIAIAVGSRGIANIVAVVKTVVDFVRQQGATPFIIPAMGSHGGGTAEGQAAVLASYGITEASVQAPVCSSLETVEIPTPGFANRVFMDRLAYEADGVVLINRIKLHTDFHGPYESGLVKMSVIGLGKHRQALEIHSFGVYGLRERIPPTSRRILETGKILFGLALVENAYDETMVVKALKAGEIMEKEPDLLEIARANMPSLPIDILDVLMIDQMGKDISGAGIDPNIIGRAMIRGEAEPERPDIKAMTVHDLTPASHGNAVGLGLADVITRRLYEKIDFAATYENTVTSTFLERGKMPIFAPTDAQAFAWALRSCGRISMDAARIVRIPDTLHLGEVQVSAAVIAQIRDHPNIEIFSDAAPIFDKAGNFR